MLEGNYKLRLTPENSVLKPRAGLLFRRRQCGGWLVSFGLDLLGDMQGYKIPLEN
jgi:hypothetical protein